MDLKLGFGCMRLPMNEDSVDYDEFNKMIDYYMDNGFNYFDTAHGYIGGLSEKAIGECLTPRYPRESYELTDKLMNSETMEDFNNLMINGLKKGDFTYKIEKETSLGFYKLKKKLLDLTNNYPLKTKKILYLLQNKKENDNEIKWNNGNPLRNNLKDFEIYLEKVKNEESNNLPEIIEVLKNLKKQNYSYREKENRHGHSNSKKSFWAFGYKSLNEIKEKDINFYNTYINLHKNCCGLEKQNNVKSINQLKKEEHKRKRREWKKNNIASKKIEKKNNEENMPKKQLGLKKQRYKRNRRGKK